MKTMTGVQYEKDMLGRARYARIDLNKYSVTMDELQAFLNGSVSNKRSRRAVSQVEQSPYNPEYVAMINQAERDIKEGKGKKIAIADLWK
ncbi:hypothetical protein FACS1894199_10190 [Bacteroidia bacterium]|nr:hypothetical protein FACS1894199_10190 [Bacteroidia bacterium]